MPNFSLPRLPQTQAGWSELQVWWQQVVEAIEAQEALQDAAIIAIAAAQATATAAAREAARINSYTAPTKVLTASDGGASATITVAGHTRIYAPQGIILVPSVSITGAALTGLAYSTTYAVYYDDATLLVTAPTFVATTTIATAQAGAAAGRHHLGVITTPAAAGAPVTGGGAYAPGSSVGGELQ